MPAGIRAAAKLCFHLLFSSVRGKVLLALELLGVALNFVSLGHASVDSDATRPYLADCVGVIGLPISLIIITFAYKELGEHTIIIV